MRILMVDPGPGFSVADCHNGWREAFTELGVTVGSFNLSDRLTFYTLASKQVDGEWVPMLTEQGAVRLAAKGIEAACFEMGPDVLFVTSCFHVPHQVLDVVRARGIKVVVLHTEQPYELDRELAVAGHADLNLLNDPTHLATFQSVAPSVYSPHAYRPAVHHPGPALPDLVSDFCFVGTGFPSRVRFLEAVNWAGVDVALGGMWQELAADSPLSKFVGHDLEACMDNTETADAYRSTKCSANLYRREADRRELTAGWAMGPREVELAACGTFFLREARGEGDQVLPMIPTFTCPADFEAQLRWWLAHPDQRADVAAHARAAVADRTFRSNAVQLLRILEAH